jgi:arsenate reductase
VTGERTAAGDPIRVIFVCTGNSARSQMAEAILRREGGDAFEVVSAGVDPRGVHPLTIRALAEAGIDISEARSKSVNDYLGQAFDYVVTVCDRAREACPYFPGGREMLHWGFDDPAEAEGSEAERLAVFERVLGEVSHRIRTFVPFALTARRRRSADTKPVDAARP